MAGRFSRRQVIEITGVARSNLSYLDWNLKIINPERVGNANKPSCFYTWEDLLIVAMVEELKNGGISSSVSYRIAAHLAGAGWPRRFEKRCLRATAEAIDWSHELPCTARSIATGILEIEVVALFPTFWNSMFEGIRDRAKNRGWTDVIEPYIPK